jgi:phenylacetate-CoA ligase
MKTHKLFDHKQGALQRQLEQIADHPFYREYYKDKNVSLDSVSDWDDFTELPFTTTSAIKTHFEKTSPRQAFYSDKVRLINLTPTDDDLMPEYNTQNDLEEMAKAYGEQLKSQGIDEGDVVINCTGYTTFIGGISAHMALQAAGAAVVPAGPGDSDQAADLAEKFQAEGIVANPSFGMKIGEKLSSPINVFVSGGAPLSAVPGLREQLRDVFDGDPVVVDNYALSEILPVAAECRHENGLHIADEYVLAEVIDPDTGTPVELGERGELVLTHLQKEAMPLVRYRTGDLTTLVEEECECGRSITLPNGVFGRTDNRKKVKGVKIYPDTVRTVLSNYPNLSGEFIIELTRPEETDHMKIVCQAQTPNEIETEELTRELEDKLLVSPDELEIKKEIEETDEPVIDYRFENAQ